MNAVKLTVAAVLAADTTAVPALEITVIAVGAIVNAVIAVLADDENADAAESPLDERTLAPVGAAENAVIAAEADDVKKEPAASAILVPFAVAKTGAEVGVAVKAVRADDAVANVEAAERLAEVRFVTAELTAVDPAFAPYTETVHEVEAAAHDRR